MDCGPAALKSLLEGFGIPVNYGRLREACQTGVDGTSIDTIEEVANQLGLRAEQIMLPADHVLIDEARALPAIAVVVLPNGVTHFVIVWRRFGRFVELMDPAVGRRWVSAARFLSDLYHSPAARRGRGLARVCRLRRIFSRRLRRRLHVLGIASDAGCRPQPSHDPSWRSLAALGRRRSDARLARGFRRHRSRRRERSRARGISRSTTRPSRNIIGRFVPTREDGQLVDARRSPGPRLGYCGEAAAPSSPELLAALQQPSARPGTRVAAIAPRRRRLHSSRHRHRARVSQRRGDRGSDSLSRIDRMLAAASSPPRYRVLGRRCCLLEIPLTSSLLRFGRRLEIRLRLAFLEKIPRLGDRYFQSRPKSDMAERSHSIHLIRRLPELGGQLLRYSFEIVFTTAGIIWIDPAARAHRDCSPHSPLSRFRSCRSLCLMERDLRLRTHAGALTHFYLDALLGLVAIHTHGGQPAVRREHESLLTEWARAGLNLQRAVLSLETLQFLAGFGLAIWLLASHLGRAGDAGAVLLLVYWALNLPALGQEVAIIAWQYPSYRNITLRLLEPLGALEQRALGARRREPPEGAAASIAFENVSVVAAGHPVLRDINLSIAAGSHVAIVGASGAGKSSLVGLLLGWHRAAIRQRSSSMAWSWTMRVSINCARTSRGWTRRCSSGIGRSLENLRYGIRRNACADR